MIVQTLQNTGLNRAGLRLLLLACCLLLGIHSAGAQVRTASSGKDFYLACPSLATALHQVLRLSITAVRAATVDITFMENDSTVQIILAAGETREMVIPREKLMLRRDEYVSRRTLHITSTEPVTVLFTNDAPALADGYCAPPTPALGFSYMAMAYASLPANDIYRTMIAVVATDDQTDVRVTPTVNTLGGMIAGITTVRRLNRGEVYHIMARNAGAADLTGTRVESNKPVVVLSGHEGTTLRGVGGAANTLLEAMPPVVDWGATYYSIPLPGAGEGFFRVAALRAATGVYVNGLRVATLAAGGVHEFRAEGPVQIRATAPVLAAQFTTHTFTDTIPNGDPSMMILNPAEYYADVFQWSTPDLPPRIYRRLEDSVVVPFRHHVLITAPADVRGSVQLDGRPVTLDVPYGSGPYYSAIVRIEPGTHMLTASGPVNAQLFGISEFDAYSMPAGVRLRDPLRGAPLVGRSCQESFDTTLVVANVGIDQIEIVGVDFPANMPGSLLSPSLPAIVPVSGEQGLRIRFSGMPFGTRSGTLTVRTTTSAGRPLLIPVEITRDSSAIAPLEEDVLFPPVTAADPSRDSTILVVNSGSGAVTVAEAIANGPFRVVAPVLPQTVAEGDTLRLTVRFNPALPGEYSGGVTLRPSPCGVPVAVKLRGRMLRPAGVAARADSIPPLLCSDSTTRDFAAVIRNTGEEELHIDSITIAGVVPGEFVLPAPQVARRIAGGDSLVVMIRFQPAGFGSRPAIVRVWSRTAAGGYLVLPVTGRRERTEIALSVPVLDFGALQGCEPGGRRTFRITNSGTIPLMIDSLLSGGGDFLMQGEKRFLLGAGESREVEVLFAPLGSGERRDMLRIRGTPCGLLALLPLVGEQKGADLAVETDTLDFGAVPLCQLPGGIPVVLRNTGAVPDTLLSLAVEGDGFTIEGDNSFPLGVGQERLVHVRFTPAGTGDFEAMLVIHAAPCDMRRRVVLRGSALALEAPAIADVSFTGRALPARATVTVRNSNPFPLSAGGIRIVPDIPGLRVADLPFPLVVPAGDSADLVLEYSGTGAFRTEGTLLIEGPCSLSAMFGIVREEEGERIALELLLPDTAATVDQRIGIPLRLLSSAPVDGAMTVTGEILWDRTMLSPERLLTPVPGGSITITGDRLEGRERAIAFRYRGPFPADGTLGMLESLVLLGLSDTTSLRIAVPAVALEKGAGEIAGRDGLFRTLGICRIGGDRFIRLQEMSKLGLSTPNPASDRAAIRFEIPAGGPVLLRLFDAMGNEVARPADREFPAGLHEIGIDLRTFPSGIYTYELRTGGAVLRETMIVTK